jgi:hypothetical protein
MLQGLVQFVFQNFVLAFQFNEMRLNCHEKSPLLRGPQGDSASSSDVVTGSREETRSFLLAKRD